ncbi:hypothetical protein EKE94_17055 [Mesobaculum littorinae]|uniref:Uncharacterized protein n=1 Tax=Mesobaculum littorinae TaxID=2486419 RepID=A0A438ADM1_9RHOB|nr:hypothetical protein [Mesobaculum littorinae]RVV96796.1 hypothetical protein EKE94_17055 [Mesobaculum littorinae]
MAMLAPYAPRGVAQAGTWDAGLLTLKAYTIRAAGALAPDETAASDRLRRDLPGAARAEGEAHGPGFAILHAGEDGHWLMGHWWAHGDMLCQRLYRADRPGAEFIAQDDRPLFACVWELVLIAHERAAWVRHMLTETPAPAAYLSDRLAPGEY